MVAGTETKVERRNGDDRGRGRGNENGGDGRGGGGGSSNGIVVKQCRKGMEWTMIETVVEVRTEVGADDI
jgi:hypothetical protein